MKKDFSPEQAELIRMITDYMEKGFLENIVDMVTHDPSLLFLLPRMILDERLRVRLGTAALIEELKERRSLQLHETTHLLLPLLKHEEANVRGDVAYILGIIGDERALSGLYPLIHDPNKDVRYIARDAVNDIEKGQDGGR